MCSAYGLDATGKDDVALYNAFIDFVIEEYASGRRVVLIVDEAQNLGRGRLEELRVLSNINVDKHLLVQIVLVGQPELRDMMRMPQLRQFAQRIGADYHIGRLNEDETLAYVQHRLRVAGGPRTDLFTTAALKLVHASSRGIPRLINQLCDTALVYGYAEQREHRCGADAGSDQGSVRGRDIPGPTGQAEQHKRESFRTSLVSQVTLPNSPCVPSGFFTCLWLSIGSCPQALAVVPSGPQ